MGVCTLDMAYLLFQLEVKTAQISDLLVEIKGLNFQLCALRYVNMSIVTLQPAARWGDHVLSRPLCAHVAYIVKWQNFKLDNGLCFRGLNAGGGSSPGSRCTQYT